MDIELAENFILDRYGKFISPDPNSGCWLWDGAVHRKRLPYYGYVSFEGKAQTMNSVIRKLRGFTGHQMRHLCGVGLCVNPRHMVDGTAKQNMQDVPSEVRSERARKRQAALTPEQRSAIAKKRAAAFVATLTPEKKAEKVRQLLAGQKRWGG
jgi:hypothetical protein